MTNSTTIGIENKLKAMSESASAAYHLAEAAYEKSPSEATQFKLKCALDNDVRAYNRFVKVSFIDKLRA